MVADNQIMLAVIAELKNRCGGSLAEHCCGNSADLCYWGADRSVVIWTDIHLDGSLLTIKSIGDPSRRAADTINFAVELSRPDSIDQVYQIVTRAVTS